MNKILKDNRQLLISALETMHGKRISDTRLAIMADELIAHRSEQRDPLAFDERMHLYLTRLDNAVHQNSDSDSQHTLTTLAIMNMIPSITEPEVLPGSA